MPASICHETKATLVYSRLAKRLRALGLTSFRDYCALVAVAGGRRRAPADARGADHQRHPLLPRDAPFRPSEDKCCRRCSPRAPQRRPCAHLVGGLLDGQEPYSIALTILSLMPDAADYDVKILATDIDPNMVATARGRRL